MRCWKARAVSPRKETPDPDQPMPRALQTMVVVGTRPDVIKLAPVILAMRRHPALFRVRICTTGQHPDWALAMLAAADLTPDHNLSVHRRGQSLTDLSIAILSGMQSLLALSQPDVVIVQGDTVTAFAAALAAAHARIPVVHVEAGLRSGSRSAPFPEEMYRQCITRLADLHCAPTQLAKHNLIAERVPSRDITLCGNTVIDALRTISTMAPPTFLPVGRSADRRLLLFTCHRRENWEAPFEAICAAAMRLAERDDVEIVFVLHPNPALISVAKRVLNSGGNLQIMPPLDYATFVWLLSHAYLVLSDSGGVQEEAAALGTPLLVLRETTERMEGVITGTARVVGTSETVIIHAAVELLDDPMKHVAMQIPCTQYGDGYAADRIIDAILNRWGATAARDAEPATGLFGKLPAQSS
jgi:UDP-N-acetylglucosamine 2-epimerase (non-hydrolysing)